MLNVQALTSTLSAMSLPQLQQYASLHKNDPYVVTMALSIANQKKQMQTAAQGQAGQQPMPKVVDQEIGQMAAPAAPPPQQQPQQRQPQAAPMPEEVGIGQLPTPNIAKMAGGGIVAFGDGGEVPRYNGTTGSFVGPQFGLNELLKQLGITAQEFLASPPEQQRAIREMATSAGAQPTTPTAAAAPTPAATAPNTSASLSSTLGKYAGALKSGLGGLNILGLGYQLFGTSPEEMATLKKADAARLGKATGETLKNLGIPEGSASAPMSSAEVDALTAVPPAGGAENTATDGGAKPPVAPPKDRMAELQAQFKALGGGAPTAGAGAGISALNTKPMSADEAKAAAGQLYTAAPLLGKLDTLRDSVEQDINKRRTQMLEEQASMPQYGVEAEKRLRAQEKELADDKKAAGWMAVLETGLGIMAGTSPFALANIGAGGQKGLASYKDAMKDFKKLQSELDKAQADIERARYAAKREDSKTRIEFEDRAAARMDNVNKIGIDVTGKIFEVNANTASKIWDVSFAQAQQNLRTQYQEQGANTRTAAGLQNQTRLEMLRLAQPGAQEQLFTALADPNSAAAKGLKAYGEVMGPSTRSETALLQKYMGPLGEANLRMMEAGTPEQQLEARQIRQRLKEAMGIGAISAVGTPASVNRP
jgi:hypothetical protein